MIKITATNETLLADLRGMARKLPHTNEETAQIAYCDDLAFNIRSLRTQLEAVQKENAELQERVRVLEGKQTKWAKVLSLAWNSAYCLYYELEAIRPAGGFKSEPALIDCRLAALTREIDGG